VKITAVRTFPIHLTVRPEFYIVSSAGAHAVSRYVVLAIETDAGVTGWGEATVVPGWSGETQGGALALLHDYIIPLLIGRDPLNLNALIPAIDATAIDNPFTKAAVEMALLDLAGKAQDKPVYELLGGAKNPLKIPIKFSIGLREPDDAANIAAAKVRDGFAAIKLKVGPDAEKDLARVRAVRAAIGPDVKLNVDVNGGWSIEQSIREIPRYAPYRLEYVEQPTPRWDIDGLAQVRRAVDVPIMADEAVFAVHHAEQVISKQAGRSDQHLSRKERRNSQGEAHLRPGGGGGNRLPPRVEPRVGHRHRRDVPPRRCVRERASSPVPRRYPRPPLLRREAARQASAI
jgi:muconate cycloisomerase